MKRVLLAGAALVGLAGTACGDGVAYRLPPDGSWVLYRFDWIEGGESYTRRPGDRGKVVEEPADRAAFRKWYKEADADEKEMTFIVRSVGRPKIDGAWHRWLELVDNPKEEGAQKPKRRAIILKLLIAEEHFRAGEDPFAHVCKMYMSDRRPDGQNFLTEVTDADRRRYEIDRFRSHFPVPPPGTARRTGVLRKTTLGLVAEGEVMTFDFGFRGKLFAGKKGRFEERGRYEVFVSDEVPFGLVGWVKTDGESLVDHGDGVGYGERGGKTLMDIKEFGTGAKSGLPDSK
jgi:hypothetical protein